MAVTKEQVRAARALLGWTQEYLAERAQMAKQTIVDFERGQGNAYRRTITDIQRTLEEGGVIFVDKTPQSGPGVRLAK